MPSTFTTNYRDLNGLNALALDCEGTENVYLGIRPFGFHAGNMVPLVAYPIALCNKMEGLGKTPKFNIYLFLNDYEQHVLGGPDLKKYEFNRWPADTTIQYAPAPDGSNQSAADYWCPIITHQVAEVTRRFPEVKVIPVRNSQMKHLPTFRNVTLEVLRNPEAISQLLRDVTKKEVLDGAQYAMAISPTNHKPVWDTRVTSDGLIELHEAQGVTIHRFEDLDYWIDHKPLALPRLVEFDIDLCITGVDHLLDGDLEIRSALIHHFGLETRTRDFRTAYAPLVRDRNGKKMSKSSGNTENHRLEHLLELLEPNKSAKAVPIPGRTI